jgi:hypothetical protein
MCGQRGPGRGLTATFIYHDLCVPQLTPRKRTARRMEEEEWARLCHGQHVKEK